MKCPNCKDKYPAIIVYGYCVDENDNEYPFNLRVYEAGCSLPAWGVKDQWSTDYVWPTRFCYKCREKFKYTAESYAFNMTYLEALELHKKLFPDMTKIKGENNNE
jgi:hypothetical protein